MHFFSAILVDFRKWGPSLFPVSYTHLDVYKRQERDQPGYEDYVRQHPISEQEQQTRNPLDKFYDYRDN